MAYRRKFILLSYSDDDTYIGAPPTLNLDFTTPGNFDSRFTFLRSTVGTYFNAAGVMQTAPINTPRWDYDPVTHNIKGLLIEEGRTNLLLNSTTLVTQSVAVTAQVYVLSFYGTGTITLSGASTAGPLVGTGASPQRVTLQFTPTAGSLTLTVTGSVINAQLEAGAGVTSYIATAGTTVNRAMENCTLPVGNWFSPLASSLVTTCMVAQSPNPSTPNARTVACISDGTAVNLFRTFAQLNNSANAALGNIAANVTTTGSSLGATTGNVMMRVGGAWNGITMTGSLNGATVVSQNVNMPTGLNILTLGASFAGSASRINGWINNIMYWPRALTNFELQSVTT